MSLASALEYLGGSETTLLLALTFSFKERASLSRVWTEICDSARESRVTESQDESGSFSRTRLDFLDALCWWFIEHSRNRTDSELTACFCLCPTVISCLIFFLVSTSVVDESTFSLGAKHNVLLLIIANFVLSSWHFRPCLGRAVIGWNMMIKKIQQKENILIKKLEEFSLYYNHKKAYD